jgi:ABC-type transporter MlaC component
MSAQKSVGQALLCMALLIGCLAHAAQDGAQATTAETASKLSQATSSKTKKSKAPKTKFDKGSGETRAERDKRLARECKGKPNAGACEGFGS